MYIAYATSFRRLRVLLVTETGFTVLWVHDSHMQSVQMSTCIHVYTCMLKVTGSYGLDQVCISYECIRDCMVGLPHLSVVMWQTSGCVHV